MRCSIAGFGQRPGGRSFGAYFGKEDALIARLFDSIVSDLAYCSWRFTTMVLGFGCRMDCQGPLDQCQDQIEKDQALEL
jgi:hypothetical protein